LQIIKKKANSYSHLIETSTPKQSKIKAPKMTNNGSKKERCFDGQLTILSVSIETRGTWDAMPRRGMADGREAVLRGVANALTSG